MKPLSYFLILALGSFLLFNILSSQLISNLYFGLTQGRENDVILFLQKIEKLPLFPKELQRFEKEYGSDLKKEVFVIDVQRRQKIATLEAILKRNPLAKEVLLELSVLYDEDGNQKKSEEYLKRAKEIDPEIK